jgi:hypothetical protein
MNELMKSLYNSHNFSQTNIIEWLHLKSTTNDDHITDSFETRFPNDIEEICEVEMIYVLSTEYGNKTFGLDELHEFLINVWHGVHTNKIKFVLNFLLVQKFCPNC